MRTIVYIDALNLYYRALRDTPFRWLDPVALCDALLSLAGSGLLTMKQDPIPRIRTWKTEEKGSDVNLASHLLVDAFTGGFEKAAVVSNDSDLGWPVGHVRDALGLPVVVLNPSVHRNERLAPRGIPEDQYRRIRAAELEASQLPAQLVDSRGAIHRPDGWDRPKKH